MAKEQFLELERIESDKEIKIRLKKLPPPSKRIVLPQNGMKVLSALITRFNKTGPHEYAIKRINHLQTMNEVRLHTEETLFPGEYEVTLRLK